MIAEVLQRQIEPVAIKARRLALFERLALVWSLASGAGICLSLSGWFFGWPPPAGLIVVGLCTIGATVAVLIRYRLERPDYRKIARQIEEQHPEIRALLLTAVEQRPTGPGNRFGYLQMRVLMDAIGHATTHDWTRAVPPHRIALAQALALVAFLALTAVTVISIERPVRPGGMAYYCEVEPGDTAVEQGSPVAIVARFSGRLPSRVTLAFGQDGNDTRYPMTRNMDDPAFGALIPQVEHDILYRVEYDRYASPTYRITTYTYPELVRADVHIVYPRYAALPDRDLIDPRLIEVPEGSSLSMGFSLNKPVRRAYLADPNGHVIELQPTDVEPAGIRWMGSATVDESRQYSLELLDADGRQNRIKERFSIKVKKNLRPGIRATFPGSDLEVSALQEVPIEAQIWDDFGITGYGLAYTLPDRPTRMIEMATEGQIQLRQAIKYLIDLERFDLRPDQVVTYWFWADDLGPDDKPRRTRSPIYFLEVRPLELVFYEGQGPAQQQDQQQDQTDLGQGDQQLVQLQKQIINATWTVIQQVDPRKAEGLSQDIDIIRQSQEHVMEMAISQAAQSADDLVSTGLRAAASQMKLAIDHLQNASGQAIDEQLGLALDAEQAAYQHLLATRPRQARVVQSRDTSRSNMDRQMYQRQLQQLQLRFQQDMYESERMAQPQRQATEDIQMLSRLRELADRHRQIADQLREAQASLQQAQDHGQTEQTLRQLRRLRDQQIEAIRDLEQIQQRMDQPENQQRLAEARGRVQQARDGIRQSADQLERGMVAEAIASASRAQRQLEQAQDQLDQAPSSILAQQVRQLRAQAQELERQQDRIAQGLSNQIRSDRRGLEDARIYRDIADQLDQQSQQVQQFLDQVRQITDQAEAVEPLVARTLYQAFRQAGSSRLGQALNLASELLRRDLINQAAQLEQQARAGIQQLRTQIEQAAEGLLGDRTNALIAARDRLDGLIRQLTQQPDDPNAPVMDLQAWLEGLRQVELLLPQQDLQDQAAAIIETLIAAGRDQTRHGKPPQWDFLAGLIKGPLTELRRQVGYELSRLQPGQELGPIDRDPVPDRYAELVRRYFETLGDSNE